MSCENKVVLNRSEHERLVKIIQNWHEKLREKVQSRGDESADDVWNECCSQQRELDVYSQAMYQLASKMWETNNNFTRIDWCYATAMNYFYQGEMETFLKKERNLCSQCIKLATSTHIPLKLLDVGSCYAPFSKYPKTILPLSIDLCPATDMVRKCDFLKLIVNNTSETNLSKSNLSSLPQTITHLPSNFFHIVVFSLFLDYLPTARHRWLSCEKAMKLLCPEGLLLIVSPDSKHQNKNAHMVKSWKKALEKMGFVRIIHDKLRHVHCMAFRKRKLCNDCEWKKPVIHDFNVDVEKEYQLMFIPQDMRTYRTKQSCDKSTRLSDDDVREGFLQLPFEI